MGDKSPKAVHKQAAQKQSKANAEQRKKSEAETIRMSARAERK